MSTNLSQLTTAVRTAAARAAARRARVTLDACADYLGDPGRWAGFEDGTAVFYLSAYRWLRYQPSHEQIGTRLSSEKCHYDPKQATFFEPGGRKVIDRDAWAERIELYCTDTPAIFPQATQSLPRLLELARPAV